MTRIDHREELAAYCVPLRCSRIGALRQTSVVANPLQCLLSGAVPLVPQICHFIIRTYKKRAYAVLSLSTFNKVEKVRHERHSLLWPAPAIAFRCAAPRNPAARSGTDGGAKGAASPRL